MICSKCKAEIQEHAKYCPECGALLFEPPNDYYGSQEISPKESSEYSINNIEYAGFWRRFAALIFDYIITIIMSFIFAFAFFIDKYYDSFIIKTFPIIIAILIRWLYYAGMESSRWQATIGKLMIGIVVTDLDSKRISFGKATGRYFGKFISDLTLGIGYLMAAFTDKKQALHDKIAGCLVVDKQKDYKISEVKIPEKERLKKKKKMILVFIESLAILSIFLSGTSLILVFAEYLYDEITHWWIYRPYGDYLLFYEEGTMIGLVSVNIIISLFFFIFIITRKWKFFLRTLFSLLVLIFLLTGNYIAINQYDRIKYNSIDFNEKAIDEFRSSGLYFSKSKDPYKSPELYVGVIIDSLLSHELTGNDEIIDYKCTNLNDNFILVEWKSHSNVNKRNYYLGGIYDKYYDIVSILRFDNCIHFNEILKKNNIDFQFLSLLPWQISNEIEKQLEGIDKTNKMLERIKLVKLLPAYYWQQPYIKDNLNKVIEIYDELEKADKEEKAEILNNYRKKYSFFLKGID